MSRYVDRLRVTESLPCANVLHKMLITGQHPRHGDGVLRAA